MQIVLIPEIPCLPVGEAVTFPVLVRLTAPAVSRMARKPLNLCIDSIRDGGSTDLSGGWLRGADCIRETASPDYVPLVALNVRVTLRPWLAGCEVELLTDHERCARADRLMAVLGVLVSEEMRSLLFSLRIPAIPAEGPTVLASVVVAYDAAAGNIQAREVAQDLVLGVVPAAHAAAIPADASITREFLVLRAARVLKQAIVQADTGDLWCAIERLRDFLALPEVATATDPELRAARQRMQGYVGKLEREGYAVANRKQMTYGNHQTTREHSGVSN